MVAEAYALTMTEKQLQDAITDLATTFGWKWYHTHDSRRSNPGYPDLHLWHVKSGSFLFIEVKSSSGKVSSEQEIVLSELEDVYGPEHVDVWWPQDYNSGKIEKALRRPASPHILKARGLPVGARGSSSFQPSGAKGLT